MITYQPKSFENPKIVDIKSVITEHPEALHKLSKTIRRLKKLPKKVLRGFKFVATLVLVL